MKMANYVKEVRRHLIGEYGFRENPDNPGMPLDVPGDGNYPMEIEGRLEDVSITNGKVYLLVDLLE